jgi:hypothetical protein
MVGNPKVIAGLVTITGHQLAGADLCGNSDGNPTV